MEFLTNKNCLGDNKRSILPGTCKDMWSIRDIFYEKFHLALPHTMEALEIMNRTHPNMTLFADIYTKE